MTFEEAVEGLGKTPEEVSAKLREMGIKGYQHSRYSGPIAEYLKACGFTSVAAFPSLACLYSYNYFSVQKKIKLSIGVRKWIIEFDDGGHSEFYLDPWQQMDIYYEVKEFCAKERDYEWIHPKDIWIWV